MSPQWGQIGVPLWRYIVQDLRFEFVYACLENSTSWGQSPCGGPRDPRNGANDASKRKSTEDKGPEQRADYPNEPWRDPRKFRLVVAIEVNEQHGDDQTD